MEDNERKCDWISLTKKLASDIRKTISIATGLQNPKEQTTDSMCKFESCQEVTFESIVTWIKCHMQEVKECDSAVIRKSKNAENEEYKYRVDIYFLQGKQVLHNEIHKVIMCNSLEEDLLNSFNGGDVFIIK